MSEQPSTTGRLRRLKLSDFIAALALVVSVITLLLQVIRSHSLEGAVISIEPQGSSLSAEIMLRNYGNYPETFRRAQFIFDKDLRTCGGMLVSESIGPAVIKPGDVVVDDLTVDLAYLVNRELLPRSGTIHVGVIFQTIDSNGRIREGLYRFTNLEFRNGAIVSTVPDAADKVSFIDLLAGECDRAGS